MKTLIQGGYVVGFNGTEHEVFVGGVVVFEGDRISYVGKGYTGPIDKKIDARGCLVSPGFIGTHFHSGDNSGDYLLNEPDKPDYFGANYMTYVAPLRGRTRPPKSLDVGQRFSFIHLLKSGVTTTVEQGGPGSDPERYIDMVEEVGIRCYTGRNYSSAEYVHEADGRIEYDWNEERAVEGLNKAVAFIKQFNGAARGRIMGMLFPAYVDTCTPDLLKQSKALARELGVNIQIHTAINMIEFQTVMRAHRCTPVELLHRLGVLGPEVSLSHCLFLSGHSWTAYPYGDDMKRIGDAGSSIAHDPLKYMKLGCALESYDRCLGAGINVAIATDTFPGDIILEMRCLALSSRLMEKRFTAGHPRDVFNSATLSGAKLLGRTDLGRLEIGARADIVIIKLNDIAFGAVRDPIRALVETGTERDVRTVIVDGELLVDQGKYLRLNEDELMAKVQSNAEQYWQSLPKWHWSGKAVDEVLPPAFEMK
jgi:5-methylthioadenosine/S-adenosylhomocysteine deaminase